MRLILTVLFLILWAVPALAEFAQCHKWGSPGAGTVQMAQVWNPSSSGVAIHLTRILVHGNSGMTWNVIATDEKFTELRNPGHSTHINGSGATAAHGELRGITHSNRGEYQVYSLYVLSANGGNQLALDTDITIDPGWGLAVVARNENKAMAVCFEWSENP